MKPPDSARSALVVGAGIAGMSAAIMLREAGLSVQLVDIATDWKMSGAGLTISASTLRALRMAGLLDQVMTRGHTHAGIRVCDVEGRPIRMVVSPPLPDAEVPGAGGILRATLHAVMAERLHALDIPVRLGLTPESILKRDRGCEVALSNGGVEHVDLVVGADGLSSGVRKLLFPMAPAPIFTGQACWRLVIPRPAAIDTRHFFLGGPVKVGLTPVSQDEMYLFLLEHVPANPWRPEATQHEVLGSLLAGFGGVLADIRAALNPDSKIVYRPLESHLLRHDWWRGNAILIGDAAHATTPQLASGAGMGLEDGIVLAQEVSRSTNLTEAFRRFMRRRFERCKMVVENSLEIGRLEMSGASPADQTAVVDRSLAALAQPI
jgi:2-polyprenyl-6-methoxyphenol hydroxylase-like FAD-dependent oxidoreductase